MFHQYEGFHSFEFLCRIVLLVLFALRYRCKPEHCRMQQGYVLSLESLIT